MAPARGEVWLVDLGLAAKIRPCLVISVSIQEPDRSLVSLVPHTTSVRGTRFEAAPAIKFLKLGAFDAQSLVTVPRQRLIRRVGALTPEQLAAVEQAVVSWLGLSRAF